MGKINWAGIAETGLGAAIGLVPSLVNFGLQNYMIKDNRKYLQEQTNAQWKRDDNAYQRAVEDAKKAGLSPLSVSGGAASSSPLTSVAQAPQMDISQAIGLALSTAQLDEQKRQFNERLNFDKTVSEKNFSHLADQLRQSDNQFSQTLSAQADMFSKQQKLEDDKGEQEYLSRLSQSSLDSYRQFCSENGFYPEVKYFHDLDSYKVALETFTREFMRLDMENTVSPNPISFGVAGASLSVGASKGESINTYLNQEAEQTSAYNDLPDDLKKQAKPGKSYKLVYPIFLAKSKFSR